VRARIHLCLESGLPLIFTPLSVDRGTFSGEVPTSLGQYSSMSFCRVTPLDFIGLAFGLWALASRKSLKPCGPEIFRRAGQVPADRKR